ncbi:hypothetical protein [Streptomyces sp. DSM 40907]|uniref:hypothetical protein n=1 Tax=Streptomyces kutzneri TaxID=3051179 RepID=UPI0028D079A4|nr:hypothetical protein [Streptomyces sp. DSM 40907]
MRRASPTGTGTPAEPGRRWTATGTAGAAAGAAVVAGAGFGGPNAAGPLPAGEEAARETTKTRHTPCDRVTCGA